MTIAADDSYFEAKAEKCLILLLLLLASPTFRIVTSFKVVFVIIEAVNLNAKFAIGSAVKAAAELTPPII